MFTPRASRSPSHQALSRLVTAALCAAAVLGASVCAAASPQLNRAGLGESQRARVEAVCQKVLGLNPAEPLMSGYWSGTTDLERWTNHYRGCVTSLSDTVKLLREREVTRQADQKCRDKGYVSDSPDLALCVLQSKREGSVAGVSPLTTVILSSTASELPIAESSFFKASPRETRRREELACAAVGLEPSEPGFQGCVNALENVFHAIDNPVN